MPEGDTIFRAARTLNRALAGKVVTKFETQLPQLARVDYDSPVAGRLIESVESTGKWMSIHFSGDLALLTHMLMSGSWHIYRPGEAWKAPRHQMRVVIHTEDFVTVAFRVQIAEFHTAAGLSRHPGLRRLGPDVLATEFDEAAAASRFKARPELEAGVALLSQSLVAGIGNVFKSEVCFASRVNPFRKVASLTDAELVLLMANARQFMANSVADGVGNGMVTRTGPRQTTNRSDPSERLWVYKRSGEPCRKCGTAVLSGKQGLDARVTFWCPACQPIERR
jgi:endonuclease-8